MAISICLMFCLNSCTKEDPAPIVPKSIAISGFFNNSITPDHVQESISAIVLDAQQQGVPGVSVYFSVASGHADISNASVTTDSKGIATTTITFGTIAENVIIHAEVFGLENSPLSFQFTVQSGPPAHIEISSGNFQEAFPNARLPGYLQVKVTDQYENPVPWANVLFTVQAGGGSFVYNTGSAMTDQFGNASVQFMVGTNEPVNLITAQAGETLKIDFTAYTLFPNVLNPPRTMDGHVALSWSVTPNPSFASYAVMRDINDSGYYEQIAEITDVNTTHYNDETFSLGTLHRYYISVITKGGHHVDSNYERGEGGFFLPLDNYIYNPKLLQSADHTKFFTVDATQHKVYVIEASSLTKIDSISFSDWPYRHALSHDESKLYVTLTGTGNFAVVDLATMKVIQNVDISAALGTKSIADIYETSGGQIFASSFGGYIAKIDPLNGYSSQRVASNMSFFSGRPTFMGEHGQYLFMEESFSSPNSLFKIDLNAGNAPVVLEDDHGSLSGTQFAVLSPDGQRIYTNSGQVISTSNFIQEGVLPEAPLGIGIPDSGDEIIVCYPRGVQYTGVLILDPVTYAVKQQVPLKFNFTKVFFSADHFSVFLLTTINDRPRIYKISLP